MGADKNDLYVSMCGGSIRWDYLMLSKEGKIFKSGGYNCGCHLQRCFGTKDCERNKRDVCKTRAWKSAEGCSCAKRDSGKCEWDRVECDGIPPPPPIVLMD